MIAHGRARAATAAVREQCDVSARRQWRRRPRPRNLPVRREQAEFDEMIAAPTRAQLRPCAILVLFRDWADRPIRVHHFMLATVLEAGADAEARLRFDGAREAIFISLEVAHREVEHR